MKFFLSFLLFLVTSFGLSSCSKDDGLTEEEVLELIKKSQDSPDFLVGTWTSTNRYGFTFNEDGTGQWWYVYGTTVKNDMTWAYNNGILAAFMNVENEGWYMFTVTKLSDTEIIIGQGTRTAVYKKQ